MLVVNEIHLVQSQHRRDGRIVQNAFSLDGKWMFPFQCLLSINDQEQRIRIRRGVQRGAQHRFLQQIRRFEQTRRVYEDHLMIGPVQQPDYLPAGCLRLGCDD